MENDTEFLVDPPPAEYSEDGVDLSLIRSFLALTPAQRLAMLQDHNNFVNQVRQLNVGR